MAPRSVALKSAIREHWTNVPAGEAAIQIITKIEALDSPAEVWSMHDILGLLGPSAELQEVVAALAILAQSEYAVFRSGAVYVEGNQSHRLSSEAVQRVLDEDVLPHPVTGVMVARASTRVIPIFELIPGVLGAVQAVQPLSD